MDSVSEKTLKASETIEKEKLTPKKVYETTSNGHESISKALPSMDSDSGTVAGRENKLNNLKQEHIDKVNDTVPAIKKKRLYVDDVGPKIYSVKATLATAPFIAGNLPDAFTFLPIHGCPKSKSKPDVKEFQLDKIREFVGCDLNDEEFRKLMKYCCPSNLKNGNELELPFSVPVIRLLPVEELSKMEVNNDLWVTRKNKIRLEQEHSFDRSWKYKGVRVIPIIQEEEDKNPSVTSGPSLEPGKDTLFRIRVYRPYSYNPLLGTVRQIYLSQQRHSVLSCDVLLVGRQKLTELRDRLVCSNDIGIRVDVSNQPDNLPSSTAKDLFPSGFLFINNVFYVDKRQGCYDISEPIREWAARSGIGTFEVKELDKFRLEDIAIRLGHPEVYCHQGSCEHVFTISEVRLLNATDPLSLSSYPAHTLVGQNQTLYCNTCAEFGAKWIVEGCSRVPFDPAFFCDTCLRLYLYKDGKKICDFKAYSYRGNELNIMKPQS